MTSPDNKKPDLKEIFDKFAQKAVTDFPQLKDCFIAYSLPSDSFHGSFKKDPETARMARALKGEAFAIKNSGADVTAFSVKSNDQLYKAIACLGAASEKVVSYDLEHELGHLVAPGCYYDGSYPIHFNECVADAFAFIRQRQEHKNIPTDVEAKNWNMTVKMALGGEFSHFTMPVLRELERLAEAHDLSSLTPLQTANLAYRLVLQHAPSEQQLEKLAKIYEPLHASYAHSVDDNDFYADLKHCAKIMFEDHGKDSLMAFTLGKEFLEPFLNNRLEILGPLEMKNHKFEGAFWDDVRKKIQERAPAADTIEEKLSRESIAMQMLGHFDRTPDAVINPKDYESKQNQDYLQQARNAYKALRYSQESGITNANSLTPSQIAAIARKSADTSAAPKIIPPRPQI